MLLRHGHLGGNEGINFDVELRSDLVEANDRLGDVELTLDGGDHFQDGCLDRGIRSAFEQFMNRRADHLQRRTNEKHTGEQDHGRVDVRNGRIPRRSVEEQHESEADNHACPPQPTDQPGR